MKALYREEKMKYCGDVVYSTALLATCFCSME